MLCKLCLRKVDLRKEIIPASRTRGLFPCLLSGPRSLNHEAWGPLLCLVPEFEAAMSPSCSAHCRPAGKLVGWLNEDPGLRTERRSGRTSFRTQAQSHATNYCPTGTGSPVSIWTPQAGHWLSSPWWCRHVYAAGQSAWGHLQRLIIFLLQSCSHPASWPLSLSTSQPRKRRLREVISHDSVSQLAGEGPRTQT